MINYEHILWVYLYYTQDVIVKNQYTMKKTIKSNRLNILITPEDKEKLHYVSERLSSDKSKVIRHLINQTYELLHHE